MGATIDWSHPLSRGLVGCWLLNDSAQDLVLGKLGTLNGGANWVSTQKGKAINLDGVSDYVDCGTNDRMVKHRLSIAFLAFIPSGGSTGANLITKTETVYDDGWKIQLYYPAPEIWLHHNRSGNNLWVKTVSNIFTINTWFSGVVYVPDTNLATDVKIWVNSKEIAHGYDANGSGSLNDGTSSRVIFGTTQKLSTYALGKLAYVYIWDRQLSPSEIQQLYIDPYCFIKPQTDWNMIKAAVATARRIFLIQ